MDSSLTARIYPDLKTRHRLNFGTDFKIWKTVVKTVLFDNKVEYVLTRPKPPNPIDSTSPSKDDVFRHQKWLSDDLKAFHIILGAVHEDLFESYHHIETAKSLMDTLAAFFCKPSMARRMVKLKRFVENPLSEGRPVCDSLEEMDTMAMELDREGLEVPQEFKAVVLMNSLRKSWGVDSRTLT